jgi:magnesium chelatase family protein
MPLRLPRAFQWQMPVWDQVARYRGKISSPLIDRIEIHIEVPAVPPEDLFRSDVGDGILSGAPSPSYFASRLLQRAT